MPYDEYGRWIEETIPNGGLFTDEGFVMPEGGTYLNEPPQVYGTSGMTEGGSPMQGGSPIAPEGQQSSSMDDILARIMGHATASKDELKDLIAQWRNTLPEYQAAADAANAGDRSALADLEATYNAAEDVPYYEQIAPVVSEAANAQADPRARASQFEMLDKLKGWSDPQVTAAERFMQLQARRNQERDERAHREAALRDMASRGVRSGGAEMTALLGSQQNTGNQRLLSDLGTQAQAVNRALSATTQAGNLAGNIAGQTFAEGFQRGSAADLASRFNATESRAFQEGRVAHQTSERDKRIGREEQRFDARRGVNQQEFGRAGTMWGARGESAQAMARAAESGNQGISQALLTELGVRDAEEARRLLKEQMEKEDGDDDRDLLGIKYPLAGIDLGFQLDKKVQKSFL